MITVKSHCPGKDLLMSKVLIIDDDEEICETFSDILKHAGHDVHILKTGAEAFRVLPKLVPDVVLLDMHMPGVSGVLTLSFIRRLSRLSQSGVLTLSFIRRLSRLSQTKVIIVSGHPELAESAKAIWGADLFLAKPVTPKQLVEAVATYS